jgi:putative MATE family efflux protein
MNEPDLEQYVKHPRRSLVTLSIPVIAASVVETLYTVVDGIYVGRLGSEAFAAITFAWPFFFLLVAISLGIMSGMGSVISRHIGAKKKGDAENAAVHGLLLSLIAAVVVAAVGIPLLGPLFSMSGASGAVLEMAKTYMLIILLGNAFMFMSYANNSIFSAQGDTKTAMIVDICSLVLNIILAPIFIFIFHWGIAGAALATTIAVVFAFVQSLYYLKRSYIKLRLRSFRCSWPVMREIIWVGFPATVTLLIIAFYVLFLNRAMAHFSVNHVAAFGIASRLEGLATLPIYGLSVGAMTLAGMFYGAKRHRELSKSSWFAVKASLLVTTAIAAVLFIFPTIFLRIFTDDMDVIAIGIPYIRLDVLTLPTMAMMMIVSRVLQGMGYGMPGLVINLIRVFGVAVPLAYVFVFVLGYGYLSVAVAMVLGGIVSSGIGLLWLRARLH